MALGKLGSLVTTDANPVGIFTATESQTVTVYVNNQTNFNVRYSIGVSTSASTIQNNEYLRRNNYLAPLEVIEVEKLYIDPNQTLVAQSSVAGVSFAAIAVGSGETTGYGKSDSVLVTDATKGTNVVVSTASTDLVYTIGINNQGYDDGKVYVGVANSSGDLDNGWIIFAQTISPGANFSINDLYVAEQQQIIVKSSVKDINFATLSSIPIIGGGSGNVVGINTLTTSYFNNIIATGIITASEFHGDAIGSAATFTTLSVSSDFTSATSTLGITSATSLNTTDINVSAAATVGLTTITTESLLTNFVKVSGIVTASSFVGDGSGLTGITASGSGVIIKNLGALVGTAGTIDFGENLEVSVASGAAVTVTVPEKTFSDTSSGISTTKNLSVGGLVVSGVSTLSGRTNIQGISEGLTRVTGNIVNLVWSETGSNVGFCTLVNGPVFLKVSGIPTDSSFDNKVITFSVVINQSNIARSCESVTLNGVTKTIRWAGGTVGLGNTNCYDIFTFIGINTIGSASSTANYEILGSVNGDYRRY